LAGKVFSALGAADVRGMLHIGGPRHEARNVNLVTAYISLMRPRV